MIAQEVLSTTGIMELRGALSLTCAVVVVGGLPEGPERGAGF